MSSRGKHHDGGYGHSSAIARSASRIKEDAHGPRHPHRRTISIPSERRFVERYMHRQGNTVTREACMRGDYAEFRIKAAESLATVADDRRDCGPSGPTRPVKGTVQ